MEHFMKNEASAGPGSKRLRSFSGVPKPPGCDRQVQPQSCTTSRAITEELVNLLRPWRKHRIVYSAEW
ncbi:hypothetical protein CRENBAI_003696 [Crenichthys baileyi]|uniref:Uncharacterized protein n=1 Tax=Crenichthys baileyi TaxID=28760 RepID=A0AAV9SPF0_9TELE